MNCVLEQENHCSNYEHDSDDVAINDTAEPLRRLTFVRVEMVESDMVELLCSNAMMKPVDGQWLRNGPSRSG